MRLSFMEWLKQLVVKKHFYRSDVFRLVFQRLA